MGNLGGQEILVILLVGLIVLGPTKLPAAIRQAGRFAAETRRVAAGFRREFQDALGDPLAESKAMLKAADPRSPEAPAAAAASAPPVDQPLAETENLSAATAASEPPAETDKPPAATVPESPAETDKPPAATVPEPPAETDKPPAATESPQTESSPDDGST